MNTNTSHQISQLATPPLSASSASEIATTPPSPITRLVQSLLTVDVHAADAIANAVSVDNGSGQRIELSHDTPGPDFIK